MPGHTFIFGLADGRVIDGSIGGNSARWLNHSCQPNCEAIEDERGRVFIETLRDAMPGDELFIAYGLMIDEAITPANWLPPIPAAVEPGDVPVRCWPWSADSEPLLTHTSSNAFISEPLRAATTETRTHSSCQFIRVRCLTDSLGSR
jgi:SET domain-containing protein